MSLQGLHPHPTHRSLGSPAGQWSRFDPWFRLLPSGRLLPPHPPRQEVRPAPHRHPGHSSQEGQQALSIPANPSAPADLESQVPQGLRRRQSQSLWGLEVQQGRWSLGGQRDPAGQRLPPPHRGRQFLGRMGLGRLGGRLLPSYPSGRLRPSDQWHPPHRGDQHRHHRHRSPEFLERRSVQWLLCLQSLQQRPSLRWFPSSQWRQLNL